MDKPKGISMNNWLLSKNDNNWREYLKKHSKNSKENKKKNKT